MRFGVGLVVGLALGAAVVGGLWVYEQRSDPCLGRCGTGTWCVEGVCLLQEAETNNRTGKGRRKRRWRRRRRPGTPAAEPSLRQPTAAELAPAARGPGLKGTDVLNLDDRTNHPELTTAQVDERFRRLDRSIVACIDRARGDYDITTGRVVVGFRIERTGQIQRVRVSAPTVMQRAGLYDCIRPLVTQLRFPASDRSLIMSYPFDLN